VETRAVTQVFVLFQVRQKNYFVIHEKVVHEKTQINTGVYV